jgi:hypothetical protein
LHGCVPQAMLAFPCICTGYFFFGETARQKTQSGGGIGCFRAIHGIMDARAIIGCFTLAFCLLFGLGWPEVRKNTMWPEAECVIVGSTVRTYANCRATTPFDSCMECGGLFHSEPRCDELLPPFASSDDNTHVVLGHDRYHLKAADSAPSLCGGDYYCCDEVCDT